MGCRIATRWPAFRGAGASQAGQSARNALTSATVGGISLVTRIRRGGFVFLTWRSDHGPRHVHVYRDGHLVVKWDLEHQKPMKGRATDRLRRLLDRLVRDGVL